MTEYTAFVTVRRTADTVHTKIEFNQHARLGVNMLIAFEFLRAVLDSAEGSEALVKPFKETVKGMLEDFVNADTEGRDAFMNGFVEIHDILGYEEQE
nr:MAG TPA: hypothetical protein [Caudoviricetes sp.]